MSEEQVDVKTSGEVEDRVTHDHDAGIGASADEFDTHNPDAEDYDKVFDEFAKDEEEEETGESETTDESESEESESDETKTEEEEAKSVPYDRFKEVNDKFREEQRRTAKLEGRLETLERMLTEKPKQEEPKGPAPLPLDDVLAQEDPQAILDALQENPADFFAKLEERATIKARQANKAEDEKEAQFQRLTKSLDNFGAERPDFYDRIDEMVAHVQSDPAHNLMSAYAYNVEIPALVEKHEAEVKSLKGELDKVKETAYKEGRKKALEEIKAKGAAAVLDGSQQSRGAQATEDPELAEVKDPTALRRTITDRLLRRRATQ